MMRASCSNGGMAPVRKLPEELRRGLREVLSDRDAFLAFCEGLNAINPEKFDRLLDRLEDDLENWDATIKRVRRKIRRENTVLRLKERRAGRLRSRRRR